MFKVTGGYLPDNCAYPGLDEDFTEKKDAIECLNSYCAVLDWVKFEVTDSEGYMRLCQGLDYKQSTIRVRKAPEHPYNASKVDGVGQGSLRGH